MSSSPIQYVPLGDTIADVAMSRQVSVGLTTSSSILLALLVIASFVLNLALLTTVLSSNKLRNNLLHLMFCSMGMTNIVDVLLIMFISLLYLSNGDWYFGDWLCRVNAWAQQFIFLKTITNLMLMAMERALGLKGNHLVTLKHFWILSGVFVIIPICFAAPIFFTNFPVKTYPNRYLCAIGSKSPVLYTVIQAVVYGGCFFVLLLCFGSLLRHKSHDRSLPKRPQDYGAFIMESRALQDHLALGRLVLWLTITFLVVEGPYIFLNFFVQIRNSAELIPQYGEGSVPQDVDIVTTWLKFFFPMLVPLLVFFSCDEIWIKCSNLLLCRHHAGYPIWGPVNADTFNGPSNVLTLVATAEGLQLRVPMSTMYTDDGGNSGIGGQADESQAYTQPTRLPTQLPYRIAQEPKQSQLTPVETPLKSSVTASIGSSQRKTISTSNIPLKTVRAKKKRITVRAAKKNCNR